MSLILDSLICAAKKLQTSKVISFLIRVFELFVNDRKNVIDRYETENGIVAEESAQIERNGNGVRAVGFYLYIGDDGKEYRVDYTADAENGFVAKVM